jgi:hypothetical protein
MNHFRINSRVKVNPSNDNDSYDSFKDKVLIVTHVAKSTEDHPGYDESVSPDYLYDFKTEAGEDVPCSLYDYELIPA